MKEIDVRIMAVDGSYLNHRLRGRIEETHISWVILSKDYAFKIKKPLKLDFLDFSTLGLRKKNCEKELDLNRRFSSIYLAVLPIRFVNKKWVIGESPKGPVSEYCVQMKKMQVSKRLDNMFHLQKVKAKSIKSLAMQIASFHHKAMKTFNRFEIQKHREIFNEISTIIPTVKEHIDTHHANIVLKAIRWSDRFLKHYGDRIQTRITNGFQRDVHGDLHCGNIFLYSKPVLFDCIEFNDQFRQIDVLYELAFLCMDFERFHQKHLSQAFLQAYGQYFSAFQVNEDYTLFIYFKSLRANIRAKVHALQFEQTENQKEAALQLSEVQKYLELMNSYINQVPL
ncbi:hypothetical protein SanaruYs_05740 [Chryseotalea sanaruensis]|uniref:Aminoglycoside phosphotransferase domain-containing protein n=1 Tax=Chryseotalea sanaruensis TaxID=2482724 RepID=A0A401U657_9BACT|nr:hypothetical protein [Chryseotalea sanaruensis]GCC50359.1 hypothetical protein SanaruYs_05740 [Chryseotalea sanaruensis]